MTIDKLKYKMINMNYIKRIIESTIKDYSKMFSIVALTGPRQTGKSTTLKKIL
ncbi:MAG: hypothetical protein KA120_01420 [Candidatus Goldbacteria bacterium]|nr:hypothetical protein [Candidatus Goldiibacteriota bacterium]